MRTVVLLLQQVVDFVLKNSAGVLLSFLPFDVSILRLPVRLIGLRRLMVVATRFIV